MAGSYGNIGLIYYKKKEYDKALEYHFKSLEIHKELVGEQNFDVAISLGNIGNVYSKQFEYDKALQYYSKSLEMYKQLFGNKHIYVAMSYNNIANLFVDRLQYQSALKYYHLGIVADVRNYNDTTNITKVPAMKNYIEYKYLLNALQSKAKIFADTNIILPKFNTLSRIKLALTHYQAADTLISIARQDITTKSDKLALGEQASKIYKGAIEVCIDLESSARTSNGTHYKEQAFYFSERNKSSVLLEALAGAEALQYAGIPDTLLQIEHGLSINIANYKNLENNAENDSMQTVWNNRFFRAQRSYDSLINAFETNYLEYYNLKYNNSPTTVEQVSNLLDKRTAMHRIQLFISKATKIILVM